MDFFKKDYIVGIDIGSYSVKVAEFEAKEGEFYLARSFVKELADFSDEAACRKETVYILRKLLSGIDLKRSKITAVINDPRTYMCTITAPRIPRPELKNAIRLDAAKYFPFPAEDAIIDFEIMGEVMESGVTKYKIQVATAPRQTVNKLLGLFNEAGIKADSFVPAPYAMQKLATFASQLDGRARCLVDIGLGHTEFTIFKGKELVFYRKIAIGGNDFTKAMTGMLVSDRGKTQLTQEQAEKIKKEVGFPAQDESKVIADNISTTQISSMLRSPMEQLANELGRCLDYYREETAGAVDSISLFGGGSLLKGLANFLADELGIEVRLGNSLEYIKSKPGAIEEKDKHGHSLEMAIGAALAKAQGLNLLPEEIKQATTRIVKRAVVETITTIVLSILIFIYIGMNIQLANYNKRITAATAALSSLQPQLLAVKKAQLADEVLADEAYWEDVFKELSNIIPPDIHLTEFSMANKIIKLKGIVHSKNPEEALSSFITTLEKGILKNVKLVRAEKQDNSPFNEFELNCWVE